MGSAELDEIAGEAGRGRDRAEAAGGRTGAACPLAEGDEAERARLVATWATSFKREPRRRRCRCPPSADGIGNVSARVMIAGTLMTSLHDRETLARATLDAADALALPR